MNTLLPIATEVLLTPLLIWVYSYFAIQNKNVLPILLVATFSLSLTTAIYAPEYYAVILASIYLATWLKFMPRLVKHSDNLISKVIPIASLAFLLLVFILDSNINSWLICLSSLLGMLILKISFMLGKRRSPYFFS